MKRIIQLRIAKKQDLRSPICFLSDNSPELHFRKNFIRSFLQNENAAGLQRSLQPIVGQELFSVALAAVCLLIRRIGKDDLKSFCSGGVAQKIENVLMSNASS